MKKSILFIMIAALSIAVCACGNSQNDTTTKTDDGTTVEQPADDQEEADTDDQEETDVAGQTQEEQAAEESQVAKDFDGSGYSDTGSGSFSVKTPAGSSADGIVPVVFADPSGMVQIGAVGEGMDGANLTHIYIDGMETQTSQIGYRTDLTLMLQGESLTAGVHTVEAVQFEGNDPAAPVTMYKSAQYEVQPK